MSVRSRRQIVINEPENELKLDNVENPSNENEEKDNNYKSVDVPPKQIFNYNLKQYSSCFACWSPEL